MTKKTKDWWVSQAHKYGREVGELRDLLEQEKLACAQYKYEAESNKRMVESVTAKTLRCADMLETLVLALSKYEGHDELLQDARFYLNILVHDQKQIEAYEHYYDWARNVRRDP